MAKAHKMNRSVKKEQTAADRAAGHCGTHSDMVIGEIKEDDKIIMKIAEDENGIYTTKPENVDSGLADVCRYGRPQCRFESIEEIKNLAEQDNIVGVPMGKKKIKIIIYAEQEKENAA